MDRRPRLVLGLILAAYAAFAAVGIRRPIIYHQDFNAAQVGKHAKNFLRHGLVKTRGIMLDTSGRRLDYYPRWQDRFYPDHPPLPDLALAGMFALLGPHEWVVRLQGHLFALGCLVLFFFLVRRWYDGRTGAVATAILAVVPMFSYFSSVTVHQVPTLFFILAGLLAYSHRKWGLLVLFQFLACYSDWPGYYLAVVVFVHLGFVERRWRIAWIFPALNIAIFGIYLLHIYAADPEGGALRRLWHVLGHRSAGIPLFCYLSTEGTEVAKYFTLSGLACAIGWTIAKLRARNPGDRFVLCLPLLALDEVWLQSICFGHDYYSYYLTPFVAVAAARSLLGLRGTKGRIALASLLIATLLGQSAWLVHRRMTTPSQFEFSYRLGVAIRETTSPDDKILVLVHDLPYHTSFLGERFTDHFRRPALFHRGGIRSLEIVSLDDLLARLDSNPDGYHWVVTAEKEAATAAVEYFRRLRPEDYEREMRGFGVETLPSPLVDHLDRIAVERVERGGFLFFRLPTRHDRSSNRSSFRKKVRAEFSLRNEPACLSENRASGSRVQFPMAGDGQGLLVSLVRDSPEFDVTPPLRIDMKTELGENPDHVVAGKAPQPRHAPVRVPGGRVPSAEAPTQNPPDPLPPSAGRWPLGGSRPSRPEWPPE